MTSENLGVKRTRNFARKLLGYGFYVANFYSSYIEKHGQSFSNPAFMQSFV